MPVHARWKWRVLAGVFIVFLCSMVFIIQHHKKSLPGSVWAVYVSKITTFIAERKNHLRQNLVKTKQLLTNKDNDEPPIHFEFYTALPSMRVNVAESMVQAKNQTTNMGAATKPTVMIAKRTNQDISVDVNKSLSESAISKKEMATSPPIIDPMELEHELSAQMEQNAYVIQLGVFKNKAAALRYSQSFSESGFKATVVKTLMAEKEVYRVQLGPFSNKNQAKITQRQLVKKGVNSIVRKIEWVASN